MNDRTVIRPGGRRRNNNENEDRTVVRPRGGNTGPTGGQSYPQGNPPSAPAYQESAIKDTTSNFGYQAPPPPPQQPPPQYTPAPATAQFSNIPGATTNSLLELVSPLITLVSKVRSSSENLSIEELKSHAVERINFYQSCNFALNPDPQLVQKASYGLCCLLDELVLNTPWGASSSWASEGLLVTFHRESWGGENFFIFLDQLSANPSQNMMVIELYYVALELGFEGRYRQIPNGIRELQTVKANTYNLILRYKPSTDDSLSPRWQGIQSKNSGLLQLVPQWVIWSVAAGLAVVCYLVLSLMLGQRGSPVQARMQTFYDQEPIEVTPGNISELNRVPSAERFEPDLNRRSVDYLPLIEQQLGPEIREGLVTLNDTPTETVVRLSNGNVFNSGSDEISREYLEIIEKLGIAIREFPLRLEVTGHTDNIPINTLQFANNWALSTARAEVVKSVLVDVLQANARITARGLADTKNLVSNTSPENRALNRRVEIVIQK